MIIYGTKGRITSDPKGDILEKACPQCGNDLDLSELKKWFTLYFIPLFPYSHIETFYYCKQCESSYKQEAREQLLSGRQGQKKLQEESKKFFSETLVACLSYMANVDGHIGGEEEKIIRKTISAFPENSEKLNEIYEKVQDGKYKKDDIYAYLHKASDVLTTEGILMLIAELARMILSDGKIAKEEEKLMKNFMLICGLSEDLYETVLSKVTK